MTRASEHGIQCAFVALIHQIAPDVQLIAIPNEGAGRASQGQKKARGMMPGSPDMLAVWKGGQVWIEWKAAQGRISPAQRAAHIRLRELGQTVLVCRDVTEAVQLLELHGAPLQRVYRGGRLVFPEKVA